MQKIQHESLNLRQKYPALKKAKLNSKPMLPKEPMSLASMYRNGNQPESKESIVARRYCRFTQPACPVVADERVCECSGKCATKRCPCKANTTKCTSNCSCNVQKCMNK